MGFEPALVQRARCHPIESGSLTRPMARDASQVLLEHSVCARKGQHCGRLPQSLGLPGRESIKHCMCTLLGAMVLVRNMGQRS